MSPASSPESPAAPSQRRSPVFGWHTPSRGRCPRCRSKYQTIIDYIAGFAAVSFRISGRTVLWWRLIMWSERENRLHEKTDSNKLQLAATRKHRPKKVLESWTLQFAQVF